jgi:hypothetical protein
MLLEKIYSNNQSILYSHPPVSFSFLSKPSNSELYRTYHISQSYIEKQITEMIRKKSVDRKASLRCDDNDTR